VSGQLDALAALSPGNGVSGTQKAGREEASECVYIKVEKTLLPLLESNLVFIMLITVVIK
jgi:hypothetical protein